MFSEIPLEVLTPSAILGVVLLLIFTGKLIPKRTMDTLRQADAKLLDIKERESEHWRESYVLSEAARKELGGQLDVVVEFFRPVLKASRDDAEDVRP